MVIQLNVRVFLTNQLHYNILLNIFCVKGEKKHAAHGPEERDLS